ncbi:hypothetical protein AcW1_004923 [Taiwanofungus camphoratus]|nr:hypothetical protein AcW1_004923 [Antrodia cinnamomea]
MPKSLSKVVYKPDTQSTDEYIVIVNPQEYQRWKAGGASFSSPYRCATDVTSRPRHVNPTFPLRVRGSALIPPAARSRSQTSSTVRTPITACRSRVLRHTVHTAFQVFFSNQGAQGLLGQASRQQLDSVFGTHKDTDAVEQLLNKGEMQAGEGFHGTEVLSKDVGRGSFTIDTRGKTLTGVP